MATIIKQHEMNNRVSFTRTATAYASPSSTNEKYTYWDSSAYDATVAVYFEVVLKISTATRTAKARIHNVTDNSNPAGGELTTTSTVAVRLRSADLAGVMTTAKDYNYQTAISATTATATLYQARLIVTQTGTITKTETQIDLGNQTTNYYGPGTSYVEHPNTGYFLYTAANWDAISAVYLDATTEDDGAGTLSFAQVYDTLGNAVTGSEIQSNGAGTIARQRSTDFKANLVDGRTYLIRVKETGTSTNSQVSSATLVIQQSGALTKTETFYPIRATMHTTTATTNANLFGNVYWDDDEWSVSSKTVYHEATLQVSDATKTMNADLNDGTNDDDTISRTGATTKALVTSGSLTLDDNTNYDTQIRLTATAATGTLYGSHIKVVAVITAGASSTTQANSSKANICVNDNTQNNSTKANIKQVTAQLIDNFNDNSLDTAKWTEGEAGSATATEQNGRMELTMPASSTSSTFTQVYANQPYNLTSSEFRYEVVQMPLASTHAYCYGILQTDANNSFQFLYEAGTVYCRRKNASVQNDEATFTYSAATHVWFRLRESAGTVYWETSTDNVSWTQRASYVHGMTITSMTPSFGAGCYQNETNPGSFIVDNVNFSPTTQDNSTKANIVSTTSQNNSSIGNILASSTKDNSVVGNLLVTNSSNNSAKANIGNLPDLPWSIPYITTNSTFTLSSSNHRYSNSFVSETNIDVTSVNTYVNGKTGTCPTYRMGFQTDNSGLPSGTWVGGASNYGTFTWSSFGGWRTGVTLPSSASLTSGTRYHFVIEYDSGTIDGSNNLTLLLIGGYVLPDANRIPPFGVSSAQSYSSSDTGSGWVQDTATSENRKWTPFFYSDANGVVRGNPNTGVLATPSVDGTASGVRGEQIVPTKDVTVRTIAVYISSITGSPTSINYTLYNVTDSSTVETGTFYSGSSTGWIYKALSNPATLTAQKVYQLRMSGGTGTDTSNYWILGGLNINSAPTASKETNWYGTQMSHVSGATWTVNTNTDLSFKFLNGYIATQSVLANITAQAGTTQENSVKANIVATNTDNNSVKANIKNTYTNDNSVKADIITTNSQNNSSKADILATYSQNNQVKADIKNTYTSDNSAKASIVVTNTSDNNSKADILTTYTQANSTKADILRAGETQANQTKADIKVTTSVDNNVKANIKATYTKDNSVKANVLNTYTQNNSAKANIVAVYSQNNSVKADILNTYTQNNSVKGNILTTYTDNSSVKADILVTTSQGNNVKANILASSSVSNNVKANILNTYTQDNSVKAYINTTAVYFKDNSVKANILVVDNVDNNSAKASIVVTNTNNNSVKANILTTYSQSNSSKADILVRDNVNSNNTKANIRVNNNVVSNSSKANILNTYTQLNSVKADILSVYTANNSIKANIKNTYVSDNSSKANILNTYSQNSSAKANIKNTYTSDNSSKASIVITNNFDNSTKANILASTSINNYVKASMFHIYTQNNFVKANILATVSDNVNYALANIYMPWIYKGRPYTTREGTIYSEKSGPFRSRGDIYTPKGLPYGTRMNRVYEDRV